MKIIQVSENILQIEGFETKIKIVKCQFEKCGKYFLFVPGDYGREEKKYCSKNCMILEKWRRSNLVRQGKIEKRTKTTCPICKTEFKITKPSQKYCSNQCAYEHKKIQNRKIYIDLMQKVEHKKRESIDQQKKQEADNKMIKENILGGICKNPLCKKAYIYAYNGRIREFCSRKCGSEYQNELRKQARLEMKIRRMESKELKSVKNIHKIDEKLKEKVNKIIDDRHDFIPLPTFLEMTQRKVKDVVSYILAHKIRYITKENEWWVHDQLFKVFPVVKPLEAL